GKWNPDRDFEDTDMILSRILRLNGLEKENANAFQRYIYIHGTNHEDKIGSTTSNGCVRMTNKDIGELYDLVPLGTPVLINES
ncbi:MAG: L,D-transpeptidase, partial [Verrucomicrobiaceae bacterium]|nr:L,D-transpeptidase [Verrucomicrobiaceae bacterium]